MYIIVTHIYRNYGIFFFVKLKKKILISIPTPKHAVNLST